MRTCTITVTGKNDSEIRTAVEESLRLLDEGMTSGRDSNADGSFSFETAGHEEPSSDELDELRSTLRPDDVVGPPGLTGEILVTDATGSAAGARRIATTVCALGWDTTFANHQQEVVLRRGDRL